MISFVCVVSLRPNMLLVGLYIACFTDDFKVYQGCQAFKACSHGNVCMACYCSLLRGDAGIMPCSGSRDYWWCRCTGAAREVCWEQILATLNGGGFHSNLEASWCLFVSCTGGYLGDRMTLGLPPEVPLEDPHSSTGPVWTAVSWILWPLRGELDSFICPVSTPQVFSNHCTMLLAYWYKYLLLLLLFTTILLLSKMSVVLLSLALVLFKVYANPL